MRTTQERKFRRAARKWLDTSRIVTVILDDGWFRLNSRREDASRLLKEIEPRNLTPAKSTLFLMTSAELALLEDDLIKSKQCLTHLRPNELFPEQARWLDGASQRLKH